jgi:hypothetical protein
VKGERDKQVGPQGVEEKGWSVGGQLGERERQYVAAVVEKNRNVFAFSLEEIGQFKLFEVELKLKSEQPIFERRRKHSLREWELVDERGRELEAAGIVEECDNDFAANSVMAAKKDPEGNWKLTRFCTDLRAVNEQTAEDRYPMPLPEEVLEGLGHAKFYSTIDIRGAFHQLVVKESDRWRSGPVRNCTAGSAVRLGQGTPARGFKEQLTGPCGGWKVLHGDS